MSGGIKVRLNNGVEIPLIASGSWATPDAESQSAVKDWILNSLNNGFRHIDTAWLYDTEKAVGEAIKESGIPREETFVTTKLPWHHHSRVRESFEESLANLGTGYIDLYLMHWPGAIEYHEKDRLPKNPDGSIRLADDITFNDIWADMEKLLDTSKVKAIGVSNFSIKTLEKLLKTAKIIPAVNQIELHPYLAQNGLRDYCTRKGIALMAYTPSGYDIVRSDPVIINLSQKYNVTANQVILTWHISRKTIIVPTSKNDARQKENIHIPTISEEDLEKVWALDRGQRVCNKPDPVTGQIFGWTVEQLGWEDWHPKSKIE